MYWLSLGMNLVFIVVLCFGFGFSSVVFWFVCVVLHVDRATQSNAFLTQKTLLG